MTLHIYYCSNCGKKDYHMNRFKDITCNFCGHQMEEEKDERGRRREISAQ